TASGSIKNAPGGSGPFSMSLNAKTGMFQGRFGQPTGGPLFNFGGVLDQDSMNGLGIFVGPSGVPSPVQLELIP
ncbi:MAG TPA: hypothetical protein VGH90_11865, partial [Chthoniobacteraceae bacterium]